MLNIGGQLCIKMCMIIVDLVMHVKEHEDWQLKVLQSWSQVFQKPIHENHSFILCNQLSHKENI